MTVKATRYVTYQTSIEMFEYIIQLINLAMREGKIDWKQTGWVDSLRISLNSGYCPSNNQIDLVNKTLTELSVPYPLTLPTRDKVLTR